MKVIDKLGKGGFTKVLKIFQTAKFFPEKRKGMEGTPKDYLLGKDGRLKEGFRAKLRLHPYLEGHCHEGIVKAGWDFIWQRGSAADRNIGQKSLVLSHFGLE